MTESKDDLTKALNGVAKLYSQNLNEHGQSARSVGWRSEESQRLRFDKLATVIDPKVCNRAIAVNDFGCGYGAMFEFLESERECEIAQYHGYDISADMIKAARSRFADPRVVLTEGGRVTTESDYSFVSGTFNVRFDASDEEWQGYIEQTLEQLDRYSRMGFAFNMLSTYVDWKEEHLYYGDPMYYFDLCKRRFSKHVVLYHDYPLWEWTIAVKKVVFGA